MSLRATTLVGVILALLTLGLTVLLYDRLPAEIPTHWNLHGRIDGSIAKPWGAFVYPTMIGVIALLTIAAPALSPKGFRMESFRRAFGTVMLAIMAIPACIAAALFARAVGIAVPLERLTPALIGGMLMVMGDVLSKTQPNFFIGVRTPWTLANPEVWLRTHRLAGRLFMLAGLVAFGAAVLGLDMILPFGLIIAALLISVIYSYWIYRKLEA